MNPSVVHTPAGLRLVEQEPVDSVHALVVGRVVDELSSRAPAGLVVVATVRRAGDPVPDGPPLGFTTTTEGGWWAVAGRPGEVFPTLAVDDHVLRLELAAAGFVRTVLEVTVPGGTTGFPLYAADRALRRPAVRLRGRVLLAGSFPPLPAPGVHTVSVVAPANLVGFALPIAHPHAAGQAVTTVTLMPVAGDHALLRDAGRGATSLSMLDRTGVAVGAAVELTTAWHSALVLVRAVDGPADPARAGTVQLAAALRHRFPAEATVVRVLDVVGSGAGTVLVDEVLAGETVAVVADATAVADGQPCRLGALGAAGSELAQVRLPRGTTNSEGYYVTGPVGRAAEVQLSVTPGGGPASRHAVSYDEPDNVVDLAI